jgi:predicted RNase H-like nuclease (RuvC/YqgF family)
MDDLAVDGLQKCRETVEHLQEERQDLQQENDLLRESSERFGELAERLSTALKEERETPKVVTGASIPPSGSRCHPAPSRPLE